jgi:SAM-dependent methyltransferase
MVLDVATGGGAFASRLRGDYGNLGTIVAIDLSEDVLRRQGTPLQGIDDLLAACMDSDRLAFRDGSFDLVCISNSLHHLSDLQQTLREMLRVLRPGGEFLVSEMYRDDQTETQMTHVLMHEWWAEIDMKCGIHHMRTFTRKEILEGMSMLGLEDIVTVDYAFLERDPLDAELLKHLEAAIDGYMAKLGSAGGDPDLSSRGEVLRTRLHEVGFHGASSLALIGRKSL